MFITLGGAMRKPRGGGVPEGQAVLPLRVGGWGSVFALGFGVAWGAVEVLEFFEVHPADACGFDG